MESPEHVLFECEEMTGLKVLEIRYKLIVHASQCKGNDPQRFYAWDPVDFLLYSIDTSEVHDDLAELAFLAQVFMASMPPLAIP